MEDVVLHYKPGSAGQLSSLLERTEKLLEWFPRRVPPAFTPWFPPAADRRLPIRPSRPAPVITAATIQEALEKAQIPQDSSVSERPPDLTPTSVQGPPQPNTQPGAARRSPETLEELKDGDLIADTQAAATKPVPENKPLKTKDGERHRHRPLALICVQPQPTAPEEATKLSPEDGVCIPETPDHLPAASPQSLFGRAEPNARAETAKLPAEKQQQKPKAADGGFERSWSVFAQKGVLVHQSTQSLSKQFHKMVWNHRLHLRQRAKWVICQHNCGASGDIEKVWRDLSRAVRRSRLPTCNANIQRGQAEIWVFCDVLYSESVGKYLKEELQLSGNISLSVHKLGTIFSL